MNESTASEIEAANKTCDKRGIPPTRKSHEPDHH